MRSLFFVFLAGLTLLSSSILGQNDSIRRKTFFLIGIRAAAVHNYELFGPGSSQGKSKVRANGEGYLSLGVQSKKLRVLVDVGYASHRTKRVQTDVVSPYTYSYFYEFYLTKLNIEFLQGKKSQWIIGINVGASRLLKFNKTYDAKPPSGDQKYVYDIPQNVFWGGISFGRSIKLTEHVNLDILASNSLSTRIYPFSTSYNYYDRDTPGRNLWVKSFSLQLIYKI